MFSFWSKLLCFVAISTGLSVLGAPPAPASAPQSLFDGRTLNGWEGNTRLWRVEDGTITGGSLTEMIKENDFLCTQRAFTNFVLRLQFKLSGTEGFVNSGVQIRSKRVPNSHEVSGYQCDIGDPNWWGAIYDEARRDKVLFPTDMVAVGPVIRRGGWNDYVIRADGPRLTLWINDVQTSDYYEDDPSIPLSGVIGIQIHGGGKGLIQVKNITVEELSSTTPNGIFVGAPDPGKTVASPLKPEDQRRAFTLPPGFEMELVASEEEGVSKPITVVWDASGRLWTMTATEYPVDANDNKEIAEALYSQPRRDKVLVIDQPYAPGPHKTRVFADGLAIPLGLLPYKDGAYVQHGADIRFLRDANGDGRADQSETILTGFGIGDSHLMPHQFTRAPGGWILVAQGAFNNSQVQTKSGESVEFNRTLMGRFTPDGARFETIGWGPCNIWGLVMNPEGEIFIQEANDYGYPVMPFHVGACYPGCTPFPKLYAPTFPGLSKTGMGGTGLSGLALSDEQGAFPGAYAGVFYVANPVTQRIQAIKLERDGAHYQLVKLPDFVRSSDEWFRPVAIHFGPDGCLYIVDWYNKVISHNEIPRNHPERDKVRGRIWRVRHKDQPRSQIPDFAKIGEKELLKHLGGSSVWASHTAWQQIVDRKATSLVPDLQALAKDKQKSDATRIQALWALEGLGQATPEILEMLLADANRNVRREALRAIGGGALPTPQALAVFERMKGDADPEVRAEVIRSAARHLSKEEKALAILLQMAKEPLSAPMARSPQNGAPMKVRESYDREFERYLIRAALEKHPAQVTSYLSSAAGRGLPVENQLLASLALEPKTSATKVAALLPELKRPPVEEEVLRLAQFVGEPGVAGAMESVLKNPATRNSSAEALIKGRTRLDSAKVMPLVSNAALALWKQGDRESRELALRLASSFQLQALEPHLVAALKEGSTGQSELAIVRALREMGAAQTDLFARLAVEGKEGAVRDEAVNALAASSASEAPARLFHLWTKLTPIQRKSAMDRLASSRGGSEAIVSAVNSNVLSQKDLDPAVLEKVMLLLGDHPQLKQLLDRSGTTVQSVLYLDGNRESYVDSNLTLRGPFTVETWIRLAPGISNEDGILGRPGGADFNFADGKFRVFAGPSHGDRIIAKRRMTADLWSHIAVSRDEQGKFRIYIDGELDTDECQPLKEDLTDLDIGRVTPGRGTTALFAEYRVWDRCRTPEEIRLDFDRSFEGEEEPKGLIAHYPGAGPWGKLNGAAKVVRTLDAPPVITASEAKLQAEKFAKYRALYDRTGDVARGKQLAAACLTCHTIQGTGASIGPNLSGAGAMGAEALLRSVLTPNAAMEAGYRIYRVELTSDEVLDGFLVSQDNQATILRMPGSEDKRIPASEIRRASFVRRSIMPEGLVEGMPDADVTDLFAYLKTLR